MAKSTLPRPPWAILCPVGAICGYPYALIPHNPHRSSLVTYLPVVSGPTSTRQFWATQWDSWAQEGRLQREGRQPDAGAVGHQGGAAGVGQGQSVPLPGNGHRWLTLHLARQHQRALPHEGQLRACNGTRGDSKPGLGTPASCSPPPPLSFEPLSAG